MVDLDLVLGRSQSQELGVVEVTGSIVKEGGKFDLSKLCVREVVGPTDPFRKLGDALDVSEAVGADTGPHQFTVRSHAAGL
jgi:hypothetical protein